MSSVRKQIELNKELVEFVQNFYGPDVSLGYICNTLLTSLKQVMEENSISMPSLYKSAAKLADETIRDTS